MFDILANIILSAVISAGIEEAKKPPVTTPVPAASSSVLPANTPSISKKPAPSIPPVISTVPAINPATKPEALLP